VEKTKGKVRNEERKAARDQKKKITNDSSCQITNQEEKKKPAQKTHYQDNGSIKFNHFCLRGGESRCVKEGCLKNSGCD